MLVFEGIFNKEEHKVKINNTVLGLWAKVVMSHDSGVSSSLYNLVNEKRERVFPVKYFPRQIYNLVETTVKNRHDAKRIPSSLVQDGSIKRLSSAPTTREYASIMSSQCAGSHDLVTLDA